MKPGKLHDFLAIVLVNWIQKTSFPEAKGRVREAAEVSTCGACPCTRRSSKPSRVAHGYGYSTRVCYRTPVPAPARVYTRIRHGYTRPVLCPRHWTRPAFVCKCPQSRVDLSTEVRSHP